MALTSATRYKFINSKTGNIIYYHTLKLVLSVDEIKVEMEKVKAKVATKNALPSDTIYWEEIKDEK
ncbi:MAG: hypothetical protein ABI367_00645 [Mucilaginibacter sp.]